MPAAIGFVALLGSLILTLNAQAASPKVAAAVVERLEQAETVSVVVSPPKDNIKLKKVCFENSVRIRMHGVKASSRELPLSSGSKFKSVKIMAGEHGISVISLVPRGSMQYTCEQTSVMQVAGTIVVSVAHNGYAPWESAEKESPRLKEISQEDVAGGEEKSSEQAPDDVKGDNKTDAPEAKPDDATASPLKAKNEKATAVEDLTDDGEAEDSVETAGQESSQNDSERSLAGTIFEKKEGDDSNSIGSVTDDRSFKYAGAVLFAAFLGFVAYYLKKKKVGLAEVEDNIDILSAKKLSGHQQLMVARVNGSRFLLAVGDKTVSSLGMIPEGQDDKHAVSALAGIEMPQTQQPQAPVSQQQAHAEAAPVQRPGRVSTVPYSQIKDETPTGNTTQRSGTGSGFGADFMAAIEKISQENDRAQKEADTAREMKAASGAGDYSNPPSQSGAAIPSNVEGLMSMARMRSKITETRSLDNFDMRA